MQLVKTFGGLTTKDIWERLITFGVNKVSTFQGAKTSVFVQLKDLHAPYMIGVHCNAHMTDLVVQTLLDYDVVKHIEELLASLYMYFNSSPKCNIEFQNNATCLQTKGNKILKNVKPTWIIMLCPTKRVLEEYKTIITKMAIES